MCSPYGREPNKGKVHKHLSDTSRNSLTEVGHNQRSAAMFQTSGNRHFDLRAFKATRAPERPDSLWPTSRCIDVKPLNCFTCQVEQSALMRVYFTTNLDHKFQVCCGNKGEKILTASAEQSQTASTRGSRVTS